MLRIIIITISILCPLFSQASQSYQVDLILFAHPQNASKDIESDWVSPLIPISKNAIALQPNSSKSTGHFHLLSPLKSGLQDEYYQLNHSHHYQVLGHYSWIQPKSNQRAVELPLINKSGWQLQGTVRISQSTYYILNAKLQLSPPSNPQSIVTVSQKQRLKGGVIYYLDHPQVGMLIKIHEVG